MKKDININRKSEINEEEDISPLLAGIPVKNENNEPWRKARYSCSGAGRIPANFDSWYLTLVSND